MREDGYATELVAQEAVHIVEGHNSDQPLFLLVAFNAPHSPFHAPKEYLAKYANLPNKNRQAIAAMVDCMDAAIGQVLTALENRGMRENSLILFASDNGGSDYEGGDKNRPWRGTKGTVYEGGVRVPALMVWPGRIKPGSKVDQTLHIVDWYPTLIGRAGGSLDQPLPIDGIDIWPAVADGKSLPRDEILITVEPKVAAIRKGRWKLISSVQQDRQDASTVKLFDIEADRYETTDLSSQYPEKVKELLCRLDEWEIERCVPATATPRNLAEPPHFESPKTWGPAQ